MEEKEMSFIDHLEELRWHIVRAVIAIFVIAIVAFINNEFIFDFLIFGPMRSDFYTFKALCKIGELIQYEGLCLDISPVLIQNRTMTGQVTMHLATSFAAGFIIAFPYVFWEIWRFIAPGLLSSEKNVSRGAVFVVTFLFLTGVSFGYFILAPMAVNFLGNYEVSDMVRNEFDLSSYVSTLLTLIIGSGLLFQLPMVVYFLSKLGVVTPELMRRFRRHAVVIILLLGAVLTPPDPISQILMAIPLYSLYELSIYISAVVHKKRIKSQLNELKKY